MKLRSLVWALVLTLFVSTAHAQSVPNYGGEVHAVYAQGSYNLESHDGACAFTMAVAQALHQIDARFGLLKKNPGQNQCHDTRTAVDAVLYLSDTPGQSTAVDIIHDVGSPGAHPQWILDSPRYGPNDWQAPPAGGPDPGPGPTPEPSPDPGVDLQPIYDHLAKLDAWVQELTRNNEALRATIDALTQESQAQRDVLDSFDQFHQTGIPTGCRAAVFGIPIACGLTYPVPVQ